MADYSALVQVERGDEAGTGRPRRINGTPVERLEKFVASLFRGFTRLHPCNGARSVFTNGNMFFAILPDMHSSVSKCCRTG